MFDNSYYKRPTECPDDPELLWLPTDAALFSCPEFQPFAFLYAEDQNEWYKDYTTAHIKMSELGAKFRLVVSLDLKDLKQRQSQ